MFFTLKIFAFASAKFLTDPSISLATFNVSTIKLAKLAKQKRGKFLMQKFYTISDFETPFLY